VNNWLATLRHTLKREPAQIRVVVASVRGSAPREPGACMLVGTGAIHGSIGGGHLELKAIEIAREMLAQPTGTPPRLDRFALGATLGQCCGGAVNLWFERYDASDAAFIDAAITARALGPTVIATAMHQSGPAQRAICTRGRVPVQAFGTTTVHEDAPVVAALLRDEKPIADAMLIAGGTDQWPILYERADTRHAPLWLFGAGHVGRALVGVFADLPFDIDWIDNRQDAFPPSVPANVTRRAVESPVAQVGLAPRNAWFLVMTHSHELDYEICREILRRDDHAWAGLIGSETKAACFNLRFGREDIPPQAIARLTCPIGMGGIASKLPGAIAVSVAAQLLSQIEAASTQPAVAQANLAVAR